MARKLDSFDCRLVWAAHLMGYSVPIIAEKFGVSRPTIYRVLEESERERQAETGTRYAGRFVEMAG